jgi:hypothetical protein
VELIAARFHDDVDHGPAVVAELRGKVVIYHLELLDGLDRRLVVDVGGGAFACSGALVGAPSRRTSAVAFRCPLEAKLVPLG